MSGVARLDREGVRGFLHLPEAGTERALVLTHGAGGNCESKLLLTAASAFCTAGIAVLRCDLSFRQRRASGPPSTNAGAQDREGLQRAVLLMRELVGVRIVLGGQSYGGRQASMLAADEPDLVDGLLLFSYPLHPPGKPDRLRTEHFLRLRVPEVFVSGTRDPFGSIAELEEAIASIPVRGTLIAIEGAGHDLRGGRFDLQPIVRAVLALFAAEHGPARSIRNPQIA